MGVVLPFEPPGRPNSSSRGSSGCPRRNSDYGRSQCTSISGSRHKGGSTSLLPYRHGVTLTSVEVNPGDTILVPIIAMNRSPYLWGESADQFIPERFLNVPSRASGTPGVYGNSMSFLGGQRACIGYRFSVVEMKALLFVLTRAFVFESLPGVVIEKKTAIVTRPVVRGEMEKGPQLPLRLTPVVRS